MHNKSQLEQIFANDFSSSYFPVLAECYMNEGDFIRAKKVCTLGLEYDKYNSVAKIILAKIAILEKKPTIAEKWLKQAIANDKNNLLAIRILIKVQFMLNRKYETITRYINKILHFLPNDIEANAWLKQAFNPEQVTSNKISNANPIKKNEHPVEKKINYKITNSMATFTMLNVLKKQKSYKQALLVLDMLESKKVNLPLIKKEKKIILSLIKKKPLQK